MSLTTGAFYHIVLPTPWEKEYDVLITGVTTRDNLATFGTFDIRGTFFTPYNLGLGQYLAAVSDTTSIYLCKLVETRSPISVSSAIKFAIPSTIIDESNSEELLTCQEVTFTVGGITRYFTGPISKNTFLTTVANDLVIATKHVDDIVGDSTTISYDTVEALYESSTITDAVERRSDLLKEMKAQLSYEKLEQEIHNQSLVLKSTELDEAIAKYTSAKQALEIKQAELTTLISSNTTTASILDQIRQIMVLMITKIQSGELSTSDFPSYATLYATAKEQLGL